MVQNPNLPDLPETQALCRLSGLPLFARVDGHGQVTDVGPLRDLTLQGCSTGELILPLYGDAPHTNLATEVLAGPTYSVTANRVDRGYAIREKTASELLTEISWWFASIHSNHEVGA